MLDKKRIKIWDGSVRFKYFHNGVWYPEYCAPPETELILAMNGIRHSLVLFCNFFGYQIQDISVDEDLLLDCIKHADHRKLHYKIYHDLETNELKEASALCYWLTQYKPLTKKKTKKDGSYFYTVGQINEDFAFYISITAITSYWKEKGIPVRRLKEDTVNELIYTLHHRMSSYDSLAVVLKTIAG
jgi:hypothetical protein